MRKDLFNVIRIIKFFIIGCLTILALTDINAGKDFNDTFTLGASGNSNDTYIYMNSTGQGRFRWLDGSSKMQYSQDTGGTYINLEDSIRGLSSGPVLFGDSDGSIAQDTVNFHWDNVNKRLGLGTNSPTVPLDVVGAGKFGSSGGSVNLNASGVEIRDNLSLKLQNTANDFNVQVKAPSGLASNWTMTLPSNNGTNNYILKSDGTGVTSWVTSLSTITDRTTGYVPFGLSGSFGQDSAFFWDNTNKRLGIGTTPSTSIDTNGTIRGVQGEFGSSQEVVASTTGIELKNNKVVSLYELTANGTNKVNLKAPSNLTVASYDFTFPDDGDEPTGKMLRTNSGGNTYWGAINDVRSVEGLAIVVSVSAGDLIIDVKSRDENSFGGSTSQKPGLVGFRNSNVHTSSTVPNFEIIDDKQITVDNLATLGFYDDQVSWVYVYVINTGNTSAGIKLGVSKYPFNDQFPRQYLTTPTVPGNITAVSTSSNNAFYIYSDSALTNTTNYSIKMIGAFKIQKDVSVNLWVNNSAYPVMNGNYESIYKEPLAMKRLIGNGGSDISLANNSVILVGLETTLDTNQVETYDTYNIYDPPNTSVSCIYDGISRWRLPSTALCDIADVPRIYIPVTGYYNIGAGYYINATVTAGSVGNEITEYIDFNQVTHGTSTTRVAKTCYNDLDFAMTNKPRNLQCSHIYRLTAGDYVYFNVRQESGNSATLKRGLSPYNGEMNYFSVKLIEEVQ